LIPVFAGLCITTNIMESLFSTIKQLLNFRWYSSPYFPLKTEVSLLGHFSNQPREVTSTTMSTSIDTGALQDIKGMTPNRDMKSE